MARLGNSSPDPSPSAPATPGQISLVPISLDISVPLVVDLDGTLLLGDSLHEMAFGYCLKNPLRIFNLIVWLKKGRAFLKQQLAINAPLQPEDMTFSIEVLRLIQLEHQVGRPIFLATGSDAKVAAAVGDRLRVFSKILASDGRLNLTGSRKLAKIQEVCSGGPFIYAGNDYVDLPLWQASRIAILVRAPFSAETTLRRQIGSDRCIVLVSRAPIFTRILNALRIHQWAKNALVFVPVVLSHRLDDAHAWKHSFLAFAAFGCTASAQYLWNDIQDIHTDRQHPTKRKRSLAMGDISIPVALSLMGVLLLLAGLLILPTGIHAATLLLVYFFAAIAYSIDLKTRLGIDIILLALFYVGRIVVGAFATGIPLSTWIIGFSLFLFIALATSKRIMELSGTSAGAPGTHRRAYEPGDLPVLIAQATACATVAVGILGGYTHSPEAALLYSQPGYLWLACSLLIFWFFRYFILCRRGVTSEDPTLFALKDPVGWITLGLLITIAFFAK